MHLAIPGDGFGNTDSEALAMGESWGGYGCKDCLHRVKGLWAYGVRIKNRYLRWRTVFGIICEHFFEKEKEIMSQHRSLRGSSKITSKRNVLKRFERVNLLQKRGEWKEDSRGLGLKKTKPEA